ncbi:mitotic checkpoint regulator, MAD2B-interacting-domain-containing protein [Dichomitus squalens]|uniref:Mitotic checkpoint regulator, MAD2B-interacting-domain-containing protein n=1 Tax=Dichomitus squalens TaxID=114155 RepID=A0A4Q9N976_9APHY|nr:mitotic checkpoint regulator, MAD2B-interacting-domain-containing protein [Dichomitus squalens]
MLGVEGYGSDSDAGSDNESVPQVPLNSKGSSLTSQPSTSAKKSTFSLPPPVGAASSSKPSSRLAQPPAKTKKVKKIAIGLPSLPKDGDEDNSDHDDRPAAKKPRLESGAGASALLSMLPAPKNKAPVPAAPERVLGGGRGPGLVFKTAPSQSARTTTVEDAAEDAEDDAEQADPLDSSYSALLEERKEEDKPSLAFMPTSVKRGKANISVEEKHSAPISRPAVSSAPAVDFFSLGSSSQASSSKPAISTAPPVSSSAALPSFTAAPAVQDFQPPEPTPEDPYPGYYMLPSGQWAAHDPAYYKKFYDKWKKEYDAHVRALEKGKIKGFEGAEEQAEEVNALKEMERAKKEIQEREERKALTTAAADVPAAPKMNIKGAALGGRARSRHQLSTLLTEAYQNREDLEEKIAQGRRNRKEAGNKYGF